MWVADVSTLGHEAQVQYAAMLTALNDQFNPRNFAEAAMVGLLADAMWRARLGRISEAMPSTLLRGRGNRSPLQ